MWSIASMANARIHIILNGTDQVPKQGIPYRWKPPLSIYAQVIIMEHRSLVDGRFLLVASRTSTCSWNDALTVIRHYKKHHFRKYWTRRRCHIVWYCCERQITASSSPSTWVKLRLRQTFVFGLCIVLKAICYLNSSCARSWIQDVRFWGTNENIWTNTLGS